MYQVTVDSRLPKHSSAIIKDMPEAMLACSLPPVSTGERIAERTTSRPTSMCCHISDLNLSCTSLSLSLSPPNFTLPPPEFNPSWKPRSYHVFLARENISFYTHQSSAPCPKAKKAAAPQDLHLLNRKKKKKHPPHSLSVLPAPLPALGHPPPTQPPLLSSIPSWHKKAGSNTSALDLISLQGHMFGEAQRCLIGAWWQPPPTPHDPNPALARGGA